MGKDPLTIAESGDFVVIQRRHCASASLLICSRRQTLSKFRFVSLARNKAEQLSEPSVVKIADWRVAVRFDPFGVLRPK
jgi:hypothetical protein